MKNLILGPPGTGKTTYLLNIVDNFFKKGGRPDRVGFISFTKKAVEEARSRAANRFNLNKEDLIYYRTIHSLCFRQLCLSPDSVMQWSNYRELGNLLGEKITGKRLDDDFTVSKGDMLLSMENLSRLCCRSYDEVWEEKSTDSFIYKAEFIRFCKTLIRYKEVKNLIDYTDMLELFLKDGVTPALDLLLIDEAQDLSQLQWQIVNKLSENSKDVFIAGDDDQAIFSWSGADIDYFLNLNVDSKTILDKSYRLPKKIHSLSSSIIGRVKNRYEKNFYCKDIDGEVAWSMSIEDSPFLDKDNWLILVRSNYQMKEIEGYLRYQGFAYELSKEGKKSEFPPALQASYIWERLRKGESVTVKEGKLLLRFLPLTACLKSTAAIITKNSFSGVDFSKEWFLALNIPYEDSEYWRSVRRRGESLLNPRIKISTIHGAKGGESDNVLLFTDISNRISKSMSDNEDNETRTFYVGVTRAKSNLVLVTPQTPLHFAI